MRTSRIRRAAVAMIAAASIGAASLAVVATAATTKSLTADKTKLAYNTKKISVKAGKVTLKMTNLSTVIPHNIAVRGNGIDKKGPVVTDAVSKLTVTLKKSKKYTFYCSVSGHEAGGMKGTITVK
jgi:plastocyanin